MGTCVLNSPQQHHLFVQQFNSSTYKITLPGSAVNRHGTLRDIKTGFMPSFSFLREATDPSFPLQILLHLQVLAGKQTSETHFYKNIQIYLNLHRSLMSYLLNPQKSGSSECSLKQCTSVTECPTGLHLNPLLNDCTLNSDMTSFP